MTEPPTPLWVGTIRRLVRRSGRIRPACGRTSSTRRTDSAGGARSRRRVEPSGPRRDASPPRRGCPRSAAGRWATQRSATCAGDLPASSATACRTSMTPHVCSLSYADQASLRPCRLASSTRVPGMAPVAPRRYLPDNQPPRNGLQAISPRPSRSHTGTSSSSASRSSRLYSGCRQAYYSNPSCRATSTDFCSCHPA
jgi:hypothetical protein